MAICLNTTQPHKPEKTIVTGYVAAIPMGNRPCGCNHVTLGRHAAIAIDITEEEDEAEDDGGYSQRWTVSYTIYDSNCTLYLEKVVDKRDRVREVFLELGDDICFGGRIHVWIERAKTNFLDVGYKCDKSFQKMMVSKTNESTNPGGSVTKTVVFCYGRGSKKGLVIVEWIKKSRDDEYPYTATVAHYYAIAGGQNKPDIGLSMVLKIRGSNKNLEYTVEGPDRHPSSALFSMFEQVSRSGSWKATACPHCAQTQSEDRNNLLPARLHGPVQNTGRGFLKNEDTRGNGNGNGKMFVGRESYVMRGSISYSASAGDTQRLRSGVSSNESDTEIEDSETEGTESGDESYAESEESETEGVSSNESDAESARGGFLNNEDYMRRNRNGNLNAGKEINFNFYKKYTLDVFKSMHL